MSLKNSKGPGSSSSSFSSSVEEIVQQPKAVVEITEVLVENSVSKQSDFEKKLALFEAEQEIERQGFQQMREAIILKASQEREAVIQRYKHEAEEREQQIKILEAKIKLRKLATLDKTNFKKEF